MKLWCKRPSYAFQDYLLSGTNWFVSRPNYSAHAHAIGLPDGFRYMVYEAGAHESGCAAPRRCFKTLKEAKDFIIKTQKEETP